MVLDPDQYDEIADTFDRYSELAVWPITECLMEMTGVATGQRVLDVACGSGIVTRRVASLVGESGQAVGIDISPGQINVATQKSQEQQQNWSNFMLMDALLLAFADSTFDVVIAQFPHFPDRDRCISEMFRVLKPGFRFAICNGGSGAPRWALKNAPPIVELHPSSVLNGLFQEQLVAHFPKLSQNWIGNAPEKRIEPQVMLRDELKRVGFVDIELWSYSYTLPFHSAEEVFEWESVRTSVYRMNQAQFDESQQQAFRDGYLQTAQATLDQYGGIGLITGGLFGTGTKPA